MTLHINSNFQQLLNGIQILGEEAKNNPLEDPTYQQFINRFPTERLRKLTLDEYCVGKGDNSTFCWWLEFGLQPILGRYSPGTSKGHVLYYLRDGKVYKNRHLQNLSDQDALIYTMRIQATIAEADMSQDLSWIDDDAQLYHRADVESKGTVGPGRKLRLLSCYHPDKILPISSSSHLGHFLKIFGCPLNDIPPKTKPIARMLMLRQYLELARKSFPALTPNAFMGALYSESLGMAPAKDTDSEDVMSDKLPLEVINLSATNTIKRPLNQILYGPPGTGKTYATVDETLAILDPDFLTEHRTDRLKLKTRFDQLTQEGRVRFVTFHQSFSYEDFVEGLRAETDETTGQLRYEIVDGIFKTLCDAASVKVTQTSEAPVDINGRRIWKMSLGNTLGDDAGVYDECIANNYVLLGYGGNIDFSGCKSRAEVQVCFEQAGIKTHSSNNDYNITSVGLFVTRMKVGDILVISEGNLKFRAIGEITGDYVFKQHASYEDAYSQMRTVKWLRQYKPSLSHTELMNNKFSQMTLYELHPISVDKSKLQALLTSTFEKEKPIFGFALGEIFGNGFQVVRTTSDLVELKKPNGNLLTFPMNLLIMLTDALRQGTITLEDFGKKNVVKKMPKSKLEPHLVNGYPSILSNLIRRLSSFGSSNLSEALPHEISPARVLIIDEINRGNVSRIFGELITLIEPSKRADARESLAAILPYSKKLFSIPSNVYLIGTMNTADRSLTSMDVALRRRFVFKEMTPRPGLLAGLKVEGIPIETMLTVMNQRIEALLGRDHCLGHAYFMPLMSAPTLSKLGEIFLNQIVPLLQDYFFDDWQRIQWVLNDHRKPEYFQFVKSTGTDSEALFGESVITNTRSQLWHINEDAFLSEKSYLGVIDHRDAKE
jgi:5-methylcytosine-specific restriction protein B